MTSEAKVGLLVGLAFIVLFGVVISNSAEKNRAVSVAPLNVPIPAGPASSNDPILPAADKLDHPTQKTEIAAVNAKSNLANPLPAVAEANKTVGGSKLDQPVQPQNDQLADAGKSRDDANKSRLIAVPTVRPPMETETGMGESLAVGPNRIVPVPPKADNSTANDTSTSLANGQSPGSNAEVKYTVKSGDSWFKIARAQWGEKFAGQWKQLATANKNICKDEKALAPGMVLVIPARPDGKAPAGAPENTTAQLADGKKPANAGASDEQKADATLTRLYTVQKGDTVYKIAEKELGDKHLYKAIIELNKNSLKKDNGLAVGMRLKLPVISPATQPAETSDKPARSGKKAERATT